MVVLGEVFGEKSQCTDEIKTEDWLIVRLIDVKWTVDKLMG